MLENKILQNAFLFAEEYKSKYTACIHFKNDREMTRDVIPLTENILYGISLVATLSREKAEKGLAFLERLFHFYTEHGFGAYIHDFPNVYNDRTNVDIYMSLSFFLKNYGRVIPRANREKILLIQGKLFSLLEKKELKKVDNYIFKAATGSSTDLDIEVDSLPELERVILSKLLNGEKVTLPWHRSLGIYTGPLVDTYYLGNKALPSLLTQLTGVGSVHKSALYVSLLPKNTWRELISYETEVRSDLYINHQGDLLSIHFGRHSFIVKGRVDISLTGDHIDIILDEFEEMEFFFSDYLGSAVLVEKEKATAFYPDDTITLVTDEKRITVKFISKKHPFMGHIMKGNRYNQIIDTTLNFALYDHKVFLKRCSL